MQRFITFLFLCIVAIPCAAMASPLVTLETRGGECNMGECSQVTVLSDDGMLTVGKAQPQKTAPESVARLRTLIGETDFAALRTHKFTGTCPMAYDGQESIFTFYTSRGPERVASCETAIDVNGEPFNTFYNILRQKHENK
jgi:hypothetical protein